MSFCILLRVFAKKILQHPYRKGTRMNATMQTAIYESIESSKIIGWVNREDNLIADGTFGYADDDPSSIPMVGLSTPRGAVEQHMLQKPCPTSNFAYHVTMSHNLNSIRKKGLNPNLSHKNMGFGRMSHHKIQKDGIIFYTKGFEDAVFITESWSTGKSNQVFVILRFQNSLKASDEKIDLDSACGFYTEKVIPPHKIQVLVGNPIYGVIAIQNWYNNKPDKRSWKPISKTKNRDVLKIHTSRLENDAESEKIHNPDSRERF